MDKAYKFSDREKEHMLIIYKMHNLANKYIPNIYIYKLLDTFYKISNFFLIQKFKLKKKLKKK